MPATHPLFSKEIRIAGRAAVTFVALLCSGMEARPGGPGAPPNIIKSGAADGGGGVAPSAVFDDVEIRFTCQTAAATPRIAPRFRTPPPGRHSGPGARFARGARPCAPVRSRTTSGCVAANKKPHRAGRLRRARWGPHRGPDARCYVTVAPAEPTPEAQLRLRNCAHPRPYSACRAPPGTMSA